MMEITKEILATKILEYLNRKTTSEELAKWAEDAMLEETYQEEYFNEISDALARIGLINVKSFELPISFYLNILINLDYYTVFGLEPTVNKPTEFKYA
jgi:hypothetical protein